MDRPDVYLPPRVRARVILSGEDVVMATRQHIIVLAKPLGIVLLALVLVVYLDLNVPAGSRSFVGFLWWLFLGVVGWGVWQYIDWRERWFIATNKRMLSADGFIVRRVGMMPLGKVTDMKFERSISGRVLGYGTFVMENAGQDQALSRIPFVPQPEDNYRRLGDEIFGFGHDKTAGQAKVDQERAASSGAASQRGSSSSADDDRYDRYDRHGHDDRADDDDAAYQVGYEHPTRDDLPVVPEHVARDYERGYQRGRDDDRGRGRRGEPEEPTDAELLAAWNDRFADRYGSGRSIYRSGDDDDRRDPTRGYDG